MPATVHFATNRVLDGPPDERRELQRKRRGAVESQRGHLRHRVRQRRQPDRRHDRRHHLDPDHRQGPVLPERDRRSQRPRPQPAGLHPRLRQQLRERHHPRRLQPAMVRGLGPAAGRDQRRGLQLALGRQADQPALPQRRLSARPDHGRPVGPAHHDLLRQPRADHHQRARQGQSRLPAGAQHGQLGAAGRGGELVRPRQRRCLAVRRGRSSRPPTRSTAASISCPTAG